MCVEISECINTVSQSDEYNRVNDKEFSTKPFH